jgi:3-deoxy-D-manno-octulosonic-acid transferase
MMREMMKTSSKLIWNTVGRIMAVFAMNAMAIIGGSSLIGGIHPLKAAFLAGVTSAATVIQKLAAAYADDGKITSDEIDAAFRISPVKSNNSSE